MSSVNSLQYTSGVEITPDTTLKSKGFQEDSLDTPIAIGLNDDYTPLSITLKGR